MVPDLVNAWLAGNRKKLQVVQRSVVRLIRLMVEAKGSVK